MSIYLIDYENTGPYGLSGIEKLGKDDFIGIFHNAFTSTLPFPLAKILSESKTSIKWYLITGSGKDYLDHQLGTLCGYLIHKYENDLMTKSTLNIVIVSDDKGFDAIVDFWRQYNVIIERRSYIDKDTFEYNNKNKIYAGAQLPAHCNIKMRINNVCMSFRKRYSQVTTEDVYNLLQDSKDISIASNRMKQRYGKKVHSIVYESFEPIFEDYFAEKNAKK